MSQFFKLYRKHILILLKICVAAGCLFWVGHKQDWQQIRQAFSGLDYYSVLICGTFFLTSQLLIALRWNYLLRVQDITIKNITAIKLHLLGLFYNNFLPGSIGGDFLRAWYVSKHTHKKVEAAFSVFVDRALGTVALAILAVIGYLLIIAEGQFTVSGNSSSQQGAGLSQFLPVLAAIGAIFIILFLVIAAFGRGRTLILKIYGKIKSALLTLWKSFKIYAKRPRSVFVALLITYAAQSINIIGFWFLGKSLGVGVDLKYYFVFFPISWVVGTIPISIGGIGVIEGLLTFLFVSAGSAGEPAFALSICQRAFLMLISLPGVWIHLVGAHLPGEEFFVDSAESID